MNDIELREGATASITRAFISRGLKLIDGAELAFDWDVTIEGIEFKLRVWAIDPSFRYLPLVKLREIPEKLPCFLPHVIGKDQILCYLDTTGTYFDPFEPAISAHLIVDAIEQTLLILVDEESSNRDFGVEFGAYWAPKYPGYLTTTQLQSEASILRTSGAGNRERVEAVIHDGGKCFEQWSANRNLREYLGRYPALVIPLKDTSCIPQDRQWPPASWRDFLNWLFTYHPGTELHLLEKLIETVGQSLRIFIVLIDPVSGPFGVVVTFSATVKRSTSRFRKGRAKGKNALSVRQLRTVLKSPMHVESFERWGIEDLTEPFLINRNLGLPSLEGRKLAILGCGTVGAHIANLLSKVGAGSGRDAELSLYDGDYLRPANLGRHLLGVEYLGEKKAEGVADKIQKESVHPRTISANGYLEPEQFQSVFDNGLVIDATGDEQFSTQLSFIAKRVRQLGATVNILHVWVDANGLAVRALLDDGSGGCYRCLKTYETSSGHKTLVERFPLFTDRNELPKSARIHYQCGESYVPFSEGVSVVAAGLGQQMAMEFFSGEIGPRFRHISLHTGVRQTKSQNISRYSGCPCCNSTT